MADPTANISGRRSAFSLLEMLVLVAIIGVLAAMLAPMLARARHTAKTVVCAAHLQQLGQAILLYTTENRGVLPYACISEHDTWDTLIAPILGRTPHVTTPTTADPSPVLACPEDDRVRPTDPARGYPPAAVRSYSMPQAPVSYNGQLIRGIGAAEDLPNDQIAGFRGIRLSEVRRPSQHLLLVENQSYSRDDGTSTNIAGNQLGSWINCPLEQSGPYGSGPTPRQTVDAAAHAGGTKWNYLYCDGHVSQLAPMDTVVPRAGMSTVQALSQSSSGDWDNR